MTFFTNSNGLVFCCAEEVVWQMQVLPILLSKESCSHLGTRKLSLSTTTSNTVDGKHCKKSIVLWDRNKGIVLFSIEACLAAIGSGIFASSGLVLFKAVLVWFGDVWIVDGKPHGALELLCHLEGCCCQRYAPYLREASFLQDIGYCGGFSVKKGCSCPGFKDK